MTSLDYLRDGPNAKHLARFRITFDLLPALLSLDGTRLLRFEGFPADARVLRVDNDTHTDSMVVTAEHPSFPETHPGSHITERRIDVTEVLTVRVRDLLKAAFLEP